MFCKVNVRENSTCEGIFSADVRRNNVTHNRNIYNH